MSGQQPYPQYPPHPPQAPPYGYPQRQVSKSGISAMGTATHLVLTVFTCGCWGVVWFLHWLMTQNKTVTTTRPY
ncbi:hypothetical protein AB0B66_18725 [Catellatospora sp. NPDC049111]|uniref:hypothetical protein n=1 Tax=Catellatospora sp. NPDC049111 TaxID=3155271 RepID=UPI0033CA70A4